MNLDIGLKDLRFIISALDSLKEDYESSLKDYVDVMDENEILDLRSDIKFINCLYVYLVNFLEQNI